MRHHKCATFGNFAYSIRNNMFGDIMGKLQEMQQKVSDTKAQLATVSVSGESADGRVRAVVNGNKLVQSVHIDDSLRQSDPEELEDLLIIALNKALEKAEEVHQAAMKNTTGDLLPPHLMNMINNRG